MATATSLPTDVVAGTIGHLNHTNIVHKAVNQLTAVSWVSVTDYGAVGNGATDASTAARNTSAFSQAAATRLPVFVPPGNYYGNYNLDPGTESPTFFGLAPYTTRITIAPGKYFIDANRIWGQLHVENLYFVGGAGAIRNRYTGTNVTDVHTIDNCRFFNYTKTAISNNSSDMPLLKVKNCTFRAASEIGTMGLAFNGLTDKISIVDCEFQSNQIHIKLGYGGNNAVIQNNDFVQYEAGRPGLNRAMVWVVPRVGLNNAGSGFLLDACKFGNENLAVDDYRMLYADEKAGSYFGDRLPELAVESSGYITGHRIRDCVVLGVGEFQTPFIYSTTARLQGCWISGLMLAGNEPQYVMKFRTPGTALGSDFSDNLVGPIQYRSKNSRPVPATNRVGAARIVNLSTGKNSIRIT